MSELFLAVDIGASSGRHIVGRRENGKIETEEVYRFPNGVKEENGHLIWDMDALLGHVKEGVRTALDQFGTLASFSIDTWGCDYVLLRGEDEVRPCYAYRDGRTEAVIPVVHEKVPFSELYARTGCQFQPFNTIYQLHDDLRKGRLEGVTDFLMVPEYLLWKLTGVKVKEYTNATTTGLVNAQTGEFDIVSEAEASAFDETVEANAQRFLAPESMEAAFDGALSAKPESVGDYFRCAYRSLALSYRDAIRELAANTGRTYEKLYIVGGGAKNAFLNRLTEEATGKKVVALPIEATALGNLKIQMEQ